MKVNRRPFSIAEGVEDEKSSSFDCCFLLPVLVRFSGDETAEERTTARLGRRGGGQRGGGLNGNAVCVKKWVDIEERVDKSSQNWSAAEELRGGAGDMGFKIY